MQRVRGCWGYVRAAAAEAVWRRRGRPPWQRSPRQGCNRITRLIHDAAQGRTVLMVEHNLGIVSEICDEVTVLARGRILAQGDYASIAANEEVVEAYLGGGHA